MDKKELKETRIKSYFIDSAKNMIKGEGLQSVSVRSVAEYAGYSASTLYTYFKDINELILECLFEFINEINSFILDSIKNSENGKPRISDFYKSFIRYFIQYPSIFHLIYLESNSFFRKNLEEEKNLGEKIISLVKDNLSVDWKISSPELSEIELSEKQFSLYYSILGLLVSYINRNEPKDYTEFTKNYQTILSLYNI